MNFVPKLDAPKLDRRSFVVGAATLGGGLALGLRIPFGGDVARAATVRRKSMPGSSFAPTTP